LHRSPSHSSEFTQNGEVLSDHGGRWDRLKGELKNIV
jgi:hypothetical protein